MTEAQYTPPLGTGDTADYDRAIRRWTREMRWRGAMLELLAARAGETILDIGCGTGSFAVMLKAASPDAVVIGIDPDAEALSIARDKAQSASVSIEWRQGFARDLEAAAADAVVSSRSYRDGDHHAVSGKAPLGRARPSCPPSSASRHAIPFRARSRAIPPRSSA